MPRLPTSPCEGCPASTLRKSCVQSGREFRSPSPPAGPARRRSISPRHSASTCGCQNQRRSTSCATRSMCCCRNSSRNSAVNCARDSVEASPGETLMSSDLLTRRAALFGAAALLAPLPTILVAAPNPSPSKSTLLKLDGNENPYGPSPAARQAILASVGAAPRYADETITTLTNQLAAHEGVAPSQIVIGAGSGELLKMAGLLAVSTPSAEVVASRPTYEELPVFAQTLGLKVHWVAPDTDHRHDLSAMRGAITPLTRLVYVCNPNNPTGTAVTRDALATFIRSVPVSCTVIVDEAYMDLVDQPGVATVATRVNDVPNMAVLRTFSKLHGLAGLRIGYAIAPPELAARLAAL